MRKNKMINLMVGLNLSGLKFCPTKKCKHFLVKKQMCNQDDCIRHWKNKYIEDKFEVKK